MEWVKDSNVQDRALDSKGLEAAVGSDVWLQTNFAVLQEDDMQLVRLGIC